MKYSATRVALATATARAMIRLKDPRSTQVTPTVSTVSTSRTVKTPNRTRRGMTCT